MDWGLIFLAIGLALFIEGLLCAIFARPFKRMVLELLAQPETLVRMAGILAAVTGLVLIWLSQT